MEIEKSKAIDTINRIDDNITSKHKLKIVLGSFMLALLFDLFFTGKDPAISYFIYNTVFIITFFTINKDKINYNKKIGGFFIANSVLLSLTFGIYSNPVLYAINILLVPILVVLSNMIMIEETIDWSSITILNKIIKRITYLTLRNNPEIFILINQLLKSRHKRSMSENNKNILKGILISVPLLFIVLLLLSSADMVFSYYISNITSIFNHVSLGNFYKHTLIITIIFIYTFSYVWSYNYSYGNKKDSAVKDAKWQPVTILTVIFIINIVYLIFLIIQFSYLYGGGNNILPAGYTYAEYARKGFFQLVAVTIINFVIVISCMKHIIMDSPKVRYTAKIFFSFLIIFTFSMLFSAHYKLTLYESSYGYTYLRVFVQAFIYLLSVLLCIVLCGIWWCKINIGKLIIVLSLTAYLILNFINVDTIIAKLNINLYYSSNIIDTYYLGNLSYDAVPDLINFKQNIGGDIGIQIDESIAGKRENLKIQRKWYEFNYSMYKAKKILK